jgi:phage tail P2-like protein
MTDIYNVDLLDILPESLKQDPQVQAMCAAITPQLQAVSNAIIECVLLPRIDELPREVLDLLAWHLHVDFYNASYPVETKRQLVKNSLAWHKRKGTPSAVEELITAVFGDGEVEEWFEYGGQPYHFKVLTTNTSATTTDVQRFTRAVESVKNARSVLEAVEITATDELNLYFGNAVHIADYQEIRQVV